MNKHPRCMHTLKQEGSSGDEGYQFPIESFLFENYYCQYKDKVMSNFKNIHVQHLPKAWDFKGLLSSLSK
jgi:hypothetical protein